MANFVETEQILESSNGTLLSFVQVRVPLDTQMIESCLQRGICRREDQFLSFGASLKPGSCDQI